MPQKSSWEKLAAKKRSELTSSIPEPWRIPPALLPPASQDDVSDWPETSGWFTAEELAITSLPARELISKLALVELTSENVTKAFCKRAAAAHQLPHPFYKATVKCASIDERQTNCLTTAFFDRAIATARARDQHLARTGKPLGPFHGLPISLKDNFNVKGFDSTVGIAAHVDDPVEFDSALVRLLEEAGAVLYVKTNVPTAMMMADSVNKVFGRTLNPLNRRTNPGGSSGGESALLSFKGSPLGVGTDIGGSLRIPAACTGIFTIRPSFGRFPTRQCRSGMPGQEAVQSVNGPMARSLEDVEYYCEAVVSARPWLRDPKCLPMPWRGEQALPRRLKIAVMWHDGQVVPTPPVTRALKQTVGRLTAAGHDIVSWDPCDQGAGVALIRRMFVADGGKAIRRELERTGEPWDPAMWRYKQARELGTAEMWELQLERSAFQNKYLDRWTEAGIDAILCPTTPYSTTQHDTLNYHGYTQVWNVLDYPAVSFPTGLKVDKKLDQYDGSYKPLAAPECQEVHEKYDAELMHGMPISLQVITPRLEDEKALAITRRILEALAAPAKI